MNMPIEYEVYEQRLFHDGQDPPDPPPKGEGWVPSGSYGAVMPGGVRASLGGKRECRGVLIWTRTSQVKGPLSIPREWGAAPSVHDGPQFLEKVLLPRFREARAEGRKLQVEVDGALGYPHRFLLEAFSGLAAKVGSKEACEGVEILSRFNTALADEIKGYMRGPH